MAQVASRTDVLALSERYPDHFASMRHARVLALYASGAKGRALTALADAWRKYPKVLRMLLARNPRPPAQYAYGVEAGGDDEAWLYREAYRALWQQTGALEWVAGVRKGLR